MTIDLEDFDDLVCVLCGAPWLPPVKNRCECGGFCTWGEKQGGPPASWEVSDEGWTPRAPIASPLLRRTAAEHAYAGTMECPNCHFDGMLRKGCSNDDGTFTCPFCNHTFKEDL